MSIQLELNTQILSDASNVELVLESPIITLSLDSTGSLGTLIPLDGATGQVLAKRTSANYDIYWTSLSTVATSGVYADLSDKPSLFSGAYADLSGKPSLFSGAYADLTGRPTLPSGAIVGDSDTQTLTNKTVTDASFTIQDDLDNTKKAAFQCASLVTGTTYTYTFPATNGTFIVDLGTQNMSGSKTFSNANLGFGSSAAASTYNVAYGANASGVTKTVNIGTAGLSGSTTNINIGSAVTGALGTITFNQPIVLNSTMQIKTYTIATLPAAGTAGRRAFVTDAYMPTFLGALISGPRTNLMFPSNATTWSASPSGCVVTTANAATSPDGTTNATKLATGDTSANGHSWFKTFAGSANTTYCGSAYLKAGEYTRAQVNFGNAGFASITYGALFDLVAGTVIAVAVGSTATITLVGNGWYRCTVTGTSDADGGAYVFSMSPKPASIINVDDNYTPASTGLGIYVYGAQVETGSIATTYVPTTTAAATGTAVICPVFDNGTVWVAG